MEVWSEMYLQQKFDTTVALNFFKDLSEFMNDGGDLIHVPDLYTNSFTVQTQTVEGTEVVLDNPAEVDVTIPVDTHIYIAFMMGDKTVMQLINSEKLNNEYIRKARLLVEETIEQAVFGLYTSVVTNTIAPGAATAVSDLNVRQGIEALRTLRFDVLSEGAFFVTPAIYYNQMAGIAKYYSRDISGMNLILDGNFGEVKAQDQLYGVKLFVTTNIITAGGFDKCLLAMPEAFGWASHMGAMPRVQSNYLLQNLGTLVVVDAEYGVGVLRENAAVLYDLDNTATIA